MDERLSMAATSDQLEQALGKRERAAQTEVEASEQEGSELLEHRERLEHSGYAERLGHMEHVGGLLPALQSLLYVLVTALFLMTFTVQPIRIPSPSMEPTLLIGDFLLLDKQAAARGDDWFFPPADIKDGDVVVFHDPVDDPGVHLVKRVIGVPGDRIHLRDGVVYRNGVRLKEEYTVYRRAAADLYRDDFPNLQTMDLRVKPNWWIRLRTLVQNGELTIPQGSYFVMGDNRNDSEDSRYWGFVPRDAIVGKPVMIYFSWLQPGAEDLEGMRSGHADREDHGLVSYLNFARWERMFQVIH